MVLNEQRVILTGAAGGLGSILARMISKKGATLALVGTNAEALRKLAGELEHAHAVPGDLSNREGCEAVVDQAMSKIGGNDVLINLAGLMSFCTYEDEDIERVERLMHVNLIAPMILSRTVLPGMLAQGRGQIVNVGSMFGSIGFAYFSAYSASKFGLRGFSQALRRELVDTPIEVTYVSPRAVRTPLQSGPIMQMGAATKMNMDEPGPIAARMLNAIEAGKKETYFGFPEALFARINGVFPGVIDAGLVAQNRIARTFATPDGTSQ
ncbi:MAG TPA: SDR family oxidoreductase [Burkholderiales bacterium]|nr:SDR family oxidoreductase [Burkholderiales bacterium]